MEGSPSKGQSQAGYSANDGTANIAQCDVDQDEPLVCIYCKKRFTSRGNLNKHCRCVHQAVIIPEGSIKCLEKGCTFSCKEIDALRQHLELTHNAHMEKYKIKFESFKGLQ